MTLRLCRIYRFEAAHRLYASRLDPRENERLFGKCARPGGHGHNYEVEVCVDGELDPQVGVLIDRGRMDSIVRRSLLERVDHRNLDDVFGPDMVTTGENLAMTFFDWLAPEFEGGVRLKRLRVRETRNNSFEVHRVGRA